MTGYSTPAVLLAIALLFVPSRRRRLPGETAVRRPRRTAVVWVIAAAVGAAVGAAVVVASPKAAVAGALAVAVAGIRMRKRHRRRRRRTEAGVMAAALRTVVGELRIGAHPVSAFATAATEVADADAGVAAALRTVAARLRLGSDVAAGIRGIGSSWEMPVSWSRVEVCWRLAADHGLPISLLMAAAERDIVERQRFTDRVDASLAGPRATAVILAGLPALSVALGQLIGAQPLRLLLSGNGWLLVIGVGLVCAGLLWADRIIDGLAT